MKALRYLLQLDLRVHFRGKSYSDQSDNALAAFTAFVYKALFNRRKFWGLCLLSPNAFASDVSTPWPLY